MRPATAEVTRMQLVTVMATRIRPEAMRMQLGRRRRGSGLRDGGGSDAARGGGGGGSDAARSDDGVADATRGRDGGAEARGGDSGTNAACDGGGGADATCSGGSGVDMAQMVSSSSTLSIELPRQQVLRHNLRIESLVYSQSSSDSTINSVEIFCGVR
ncbi:hypothetical protein OsI_22676 [Oryza sativa Indica Group]|uniref:Uncharacterized protein n=1 Tax=Oryza sativa subsp. indica TaxID=39946 RepID=B8B150_ORYSI|nr:hypothetical protein OsI_22676 [Oryza sativa Indica Group]